MRAKIMVFAWNPDTSHGFVNLFRQLSKLWSGLNAHPKYTCSFRRREKPIPAKLEVKCIALHVGERSLDLLNSRLWLFPDKFERDMQRFWPDPARIRGETPDAIHESLNATANYIVDVQSNKDAHLHQLPSDHI